MIELLSLPGIVAAGIGAALTVLAVLRMRETGRDPMLVSFASTCAAMAVTSAAYVLSTNAIGPNEVITPGSVADISTWAYWVAGAASGTTWFCFGLTLHGYWQQWRRPLHWAVFAPLAVFATVASALPHPRSVAQQTRVDQSPLGFASIAVLVALAAVGTYLVFTAPGGNTRIRRQRRILGGISALALIAAVSWDLQVWLGIRVSFDLIPLSFAVYSAVLAHFVFAGQFAGISRAAAGIAFECASDALIALDGELHIIAMNQSARKLLPTAQIGELLGAARPSLARHVHSCLAAGGRYVVSFDVAIDDAAYLGKVTRTHSTLGRMVGCVLVLTDVTDVRKARRAVARFKHRDMEQVTRN